MKYFIGGLVGVAVGVAIAKVLRPSDSFCCRKVKDGIAEKLQDKLGDTLGGAVAAGADTLGVTDTGLELWEVLTA